MTERLLNKEVRGFLKNKEFVSVGTCDFDGRANVAPKFLLKIENDHIYLADYVIGRTWKNLKVNPKASLSTVNMDILTGYQINGPVEIIDKGSEYKLLMEEFREKRIQLSVARIIEGVRTKEKHRTFQTAFSEKVVIFKIRVEEIVEIVPSGELKRKKK